MAPKPSRLHRYRRVCAAHKCASCVCCCDVCVLVVLVPYLLAGGQSIFRQIGALFGYEFATSIVAPLDIIEVDRAYHSRVWLDNSALIVGTQSQVYAAERGHLCPLDTKMLIWSGTKLVTSTIIYSVVEDAAARLALNATPGDWLPWWRCDDASDRRCSPALTLQKLMAFRAGLPLPGCENGSPPPSGVQVKDAWEECAKQLFNDPSWTDDRWDTFNYDSTGLFIAGLMALKARRAVSGHEADLWPTLLQDYVIAPAGIVDATQFQSDSGDFPDGQFSYDGILACAKVPCSTPRPYYPEFPGLSGSIGCSPRQYGNFSRALLAHELVSEEHVSEITRSHGDSGGFGMGLPAFSHYGQGTWADGEGIAHSLGRNGFTPWFDRRSAEPSEHVFGVLAVRLEEQWTYAIGVALAVGLPLVVLGLAASCFVLVRACRKGGDARKKQSVAEIPRPGV